MRTQAIEEHESRQAEIAESAEAGVVCRNSLPNGISDLELQVVTRYEALPAGCWD